MNTKLTLRQTNADFWYVEATVTFPGGGQVKIISSASREPQQCIAEITAEIRDIASEMIGSLNPWLSNLTAVGFRHNEEQKEVWIESPNAGA